VIVVSNDRTIYQGIYNRQGVKEHLCCGEMVFFILATLILEALKAAKLLNLTLQNEKLTCQMT